ncbi:porin [Aquabacterium parvum]|uniref:porin n=1 Tax=Aquabacterium parvum TaxID=70584 RepID=UPI000718DD8F|nr:porin [Aquabacterium parvum]MBU0915194.1 porin [Gammaproteobacteria bacterium]
MQKRVLSSAIALALTALASGTALAQSSVTIYGNIDVSVDRVKRTSGDAITAPASTGLLGAGTAAALSSALRSQQSMTRVGPDTSSQSSLGFRGVEDLGNGYKGNFVLEGQMGVDNGALLRDGRLFGRQAYVGLTTPFGEFRAGRQYAPIFFSSALVTTERFGSTDQFVEGGLSNNLNIRWDNALTYSLQAGGFRGQLGYSPNAGVAQKVNALRSTSGGSDANGQILGGITAANENKDGRGRSLGAFGAYAISDLTVTLGYGRTNFDNTPVVAIISGSATTLFQVDDYSVWNLGGKYVFKELGLTLNGSFGRAAYDINGAGLPASLVGITDGKLKVSSLVLGTRYEIGAMAFLAQWSETKFRNESRGKNQAYTLGAEYSLSKRTTLYTRYEQIKDKGVGPAVTLAATGIREVPTLAGLGISPDGKSTQLALGVRHNF